MILNQLMRAKKVGTFMIIAWQTNSGLNVWAANRTPLIARQELRLIDGTFLAGNGAARVKNAS